MQSTIDILLVDDEPRNLDALEAMLTDADYRLLRAEDADVALKLLLDHDVAAIVLDIKMPGVSGVELAKMIKNTKRFRATPIVFLTAYMVDDQDVIAGYGAGAVDYLTKPVNPQILRHKLAVFADLHRKTRELAEVNEKLAALNESLEERVQERTAELEKSELALRASAKQKDEFIAILAHELRNPLAPLRTGLDLLLRMQSSEPPPTVTRALAAMNRQLDHMVRLIDDLLDVSRLSRGSLELKRDRVDVAVIIKSTVESLRPLFERRKQTLSADFPEGVVADVDQTRVAQIVANLLQNAAKFTPENGSIKVELTRELDVASIRVIDSGVGIAADQLEHVFEMFARIKPAGVPVEPGLGIGLALARRLAEMHGGRLTATSEGEGRGTTLTLQIPVLESATVANEEMNSDAPHETVTPLNIVVVEDNEDIAAGLGDWLEALGHRVSIARTGSSGVDLIKQNSPDLVLCDLGLPDFDGLDVCSRVRALAGAQQPVMVALTGWGREDDILRTKQVGFDHHLVKPVAPRKLTALLRNVAKSNQGAPQP